MGSQRLQSGLEKAAPVIGRRIVQRGKNVFGRVRFYRGLAIGSAVERPAKIIKGLRATALLADDRVGFEPDQIALIIEVGAPPVRFPIRTPVVEDLRLIGAILKRPPLTSGPIIQACG